MYLLWSMKNWVERIAMAPAVLVHIVHTLSFVYWVKLAKLCGIFTGPITMAECSEFRSIDLFIVLWYDNMSKLYTLSFTLNGMAYASMHPLGDGALILTTDFQTHKFMYNNILCSSHVFCSHVSQNTFIHSLVRSFSRLFVSFLFQFLSFTLQLRGSWGWRDGERVRERWMRSHLCTWHSALAKTINFFLISSVSFLNWYYRAYVFVYAGCTYQWILLFS